MHRISAPFSFSAMDFLTAWVLNCLLAECNLSPCRLQGHSNASHHISNVVLLVMLHVVQAMFRGAEVALWSAHDGRLS
jgi:hypothetical protein